MPIGDLLAQITGQASSFPADEIRVGSVTPKRKPDVQLQKTVDKMQKTVGYISSSTKTINNSSDIPSKVNTSLSRKTLGSDVSPSANVTSKSTSLSRNTQKNVTSNGPQKPLKKGSYAEIMARGKAAHATLGQVGKIQHKTIEKQPSKREREAQRIQNLKKGLSAASKFQKSSQSQVRDPSSRDNPNGKVTPMPEKKIKKSATVTTGYAGTARPKVNNTILTSRNSVQGSIPINNRNRDERHGSSSASRYHYNSEEEEGESDYESDLSDMEAAAFEVDEEEETAAKIARREDAEALAEENRLKREKEEKRKKLVAMAKSRGARSY